MATISRVTGTRREVARYACGCRVYVLAPEAEVMGGKVEWCPLHAAAAAMRGLLEAIVYSPAMVENDEPVLHEARELLAKMERPATGKEG